MLFVSFRPQNGSFQERRFGTNEILIGRSSEADLQLTAEEGVSERHCRVFLKNGACWVEDLGSRNGVEIDEQLVTSAELAAQTMFRIGKIWVRLDRFALTSPEQAPSLSAETEVLDRRTLLPVSPAAAPPVETRPPERAAPDVHASGRRRKARPDQPSGEPPPPRERQASEMQPSKPGPDRGDSEEGSAGERRDKKGRTADAVATPPKSQPDAIPWWRQGARAFMDLVLRREPVRERDIAEDARRWDAIGRPMWFHSRELKLHETDKASSLVAEYAGDSRRTMGAQRSTRLWLGAAIVLLSASSFAGARVSLPPLSVQPASIATRSACTQPATLEESNQRVGEPGKQWDAESAVWQALYALEPVARSPSCMHRSQAESELRDALARLQSTTLMRSSHPFRQVAAFDGRYAIGLDTAGQLHWAERFGQYPPRTLPGLTSDVKAFAVSPDGRRLVAGTADGQLVLWELRGPDDPLRRNTLAAHRRGVSGLAFSSDGTWLASADEDGEVQLRAVGENLSEHTHQRFTAPAKQIDRLSVHAETSTLFAIGGSRAFAWTWSGAATARAAELRTSSPISALAFSADGSSVIAGSSDGTIHLWSAPHGPRGSRRITSTGVKIQAVAASSVAPRVALSIGQDNILRGTELDKEEIRKGELPTFRVGTALTEGVDLLLVSSDGMHALARGQSGTLYAWDLANREKKNEPRELGRLDGNSTEVKLADDGSWALTGDPQTLRAWDLLSIGNGAKSVLAHQEEVTAMALSSERMLLITGGRDQRVRLWRLSPAGVPTLQHTLPVDAAVRALVLDEAGQTAVVASGSQLLIWDLTQCTTPGQCSQFEEHELSRSNPRSLLTRLAMSPDGRWLVAGDEAGHVATWSLSPSGSQRVSATRELGAAIRSLAIDPVRRLAAAGTSRGDLWVWPLDLSRDPERVSLSPGKTIRDLAFHDDPDGGILAGADDFKLYEVPLAASGQPTTSTGDGRQSYPHDDEVVSVAALGSWAASGSKDGQIYVRLEKKNQRQLPGLNSKLARLQLSKVAELLVASDKDGFLTLWPLSDEQAPSHLRIRAHRGPVNTFAIDQRGEFIVTGGNEGNIRVWPVSPARLIEQACTVVGSAPSPELRAKLPDQLTELCGGA